MSDRRTRPSHAGCPRLLFVPAGSLADGRNGHTATLLPDGRVIVIGGAGENDTILASVEVWEPNAPEEQGRRLDGL